MPAPIGVRKLLDQVEAQPLADIFGAVGLGNVDPGFEHAGFDLSQPYADQAFAGAGYGWAKMLKQLGEVLQHSLQ